ncbi:sugar phosphate isomerase/epimerase [Paenibacillaceae bacterium]|nr:sugar phosphate isomerase/epimerase [Paenibacillaceae bacterium]
MLKGVNQWCFPEGTPLDKLFAVSSEAGFDAVELNLYAPGGVGLSQDMSAAEVEAIGRLARSYGIGLHSLSTALLWGVPFSSPDAEIRAAGRASVEKQMEIAELLGIDTVLTVPGVVSTEVAYDVCYERSQNEYRQLAEIAVKRSVHIGIENVWNKFLLSPLEMARYVDELACPNIGVYFDVGNVLQSGFPEQWIRILGSRIKKVHVKDYRPAVGTGHGFVPLLSGGVDWPTVRTALDDIGYSGPLTAELDPYPVDPYQAVYDAGRHLDLILGKPAH